MSTSALSNRSYVLYLAGATISLHGLWVYRVALGWFAWQLSGSELWVGIIAFTQFAPAAIFGPIFGVLADRFDRRAASILINSLSVINMLVLGLLASMGYVDIRVLALLSLMQGVLDGAHAPVRMSLVPNLVTAEQLHSGIAFTSISFNLSRFLGPAIAAPIIAIWGVSTAFVVNGVSYLAVVAAMSLIRLNPTSQPGGTRQHPWHELVEGARYALKQEIIRRLLILTALGSVFARGALEMLPAFADKVFSGGASALAIMTSAIGAGAIATGLVLSRGTSWLKVTTIRSALTVAGILIILLSLVDRFELAVVFVTMLGISLSLSGVGSQILLQTNVDDEVRGRVSSFWSTIVFGGTSLGGLIVGASAKAWDLKSAVIGAGAMCALAAAATVRRRQPGIVPHVDDSR